MYFHFTCQKLSWYTTSEPFVGYRQEYYHDKVVTGCQKLLQGTHHYACHRVPKAVAGYPPLCLSQGAKSCCRVPTTMPVTGCQKLLQGTHHYACHRVPKAVAGYPPLCLSQGAKSCCRVPTTMPVTRCQKLLQGTHHYACHRVSLPTPLDKKLLQANLSHIGYLQFRYL